MKFRFNGQKGFSIIELMIVVGIIGVLASVGLPKMQVFLAKSKRTEARTVLGTFKTFNEAYYADGNGYALNFNSGVAGYIGYAQPLGKDFTFAAPTMTATNYTATMSTIPARPLCTGASVEVWTVTQATSITGDAVANVAPTCT